MCHGKTKISIAKIILKRHDVKTRPQKYRLTLFEFDFIWILQQTMHVQKNPNIMKANAFIIYRDLKMS